MWLWCVRDGLMIATDGTIAGRGYSGANGSRNVPEAENLPMVGPIPRGLYTIQEPRDHPSRGPYVLRLTPDRETRLFGRAGFLIHGDSIAHPGTASSGCIILGPAARKTIWTSGDHRLKVVTSLKEARDGRGVRGTAEGAGDDPDRGEDSRSSL